MERIDKEALAEVDEIISMMSIEDANKIPNSFKNFIKDKKSDLYNPSLRRDIPLYKQKLKRDTLVLCSLIYRSYLCQAEEKQKLDEKDKKELEKIEKEIREKYNPDNLFKNNKIQEQIQEEQQSENVQMIEYKEENIFIKFLNKIKTILDKLQTKITRK